VTFHVAYQQAAATRKQVVESESAEEDNNVITINTEPEVFDAVENDGGVVASHKRDEAKQKLVAKFKNANYVPKFSGKAHEDVNVWIRGMRKCFADAALEETDKLELALSGITEEAEMLINSYGECESFAALAERLTINYSTKADWRAELRSCKQTSTESFREFARRVRLTVNKANKSAAEKERLIVETLRDNSIKSISHFLCIHFGIEDLPDTVFNFTTVMKYGLSQEARDLAEHPRRNKMVNETVNVCGHEKDEVAVGPSVSLNPKVTVDWEEWRKFKNWEEEQAESALLTTNSTNRLFLCLACFGPGHGFRRCRSCSDERKNQIQQDLDDKCYDWHKLEQAKQQHEESLKARRVTHQGSRLSATISN
jgi:hypothetical protein